MRETFGNQQMLPPVSYLNPGLVIDGSSLVHEYVGPSGAQWLFPQSHFLREELRVPFGTLEREDSSYEEACDRLELLASMLAIDSGSSYVWYGEFMLGSRWGWGETQNPDVSAEIGPEWPLVGAGAFGGDPERAVGAYTKVVEIRSKTRTW